MTLIARHRSRESSGWRHWRRQCRRIDHPSNSPSDCRPGRARTTAGAADLRSARSPRCHRPRTAPRNAWLSASHAHPPTTTASRDRHASHTPTRPLMSRPCPPPPVARSSSPPSTSWPTRGCSPSSPPTPRPPAGMASSSGTTSSTARRRARCSTRGSRWPRSRWPPTRSSRARWSRRSRGGGRTSSRARPPRSTCSATAGWSSASGSAPTTTASWRPSATSPTRASRPRSSTRALVKLEDYWSGTFVPRPVQQPRIPIWAAARWPARRPVRRAARLDGLFPIDLPGPEALAELAGEIAEQRARGGHQRPLRPRHRERARHRPRALGRRRRDVVPRRLQRPAEARRRPRGDRRGPKRVAPPV